MPKQPSALEKTVLALVGLCLFFVILEAGLRLGGWVILSLQEYKNLQALKHKGSFCIVCLGESTTQNQYPSYLEKSLNQNNLGIKFSVIDKGLAGIRTTEILSQLEATLDKYQPDMVVAMMGINDYGAHMLYEATPSSSRSVFKSLKIYRLTKWLWMRVIAKCRVKNNCAGGNSPKSVAQPPAQGSLGKHLEKVSPRLDPDFEYKETGYLYSDQAGSARLEQLCQQAIKSHPQDINKYVQLGWFYKDRLRFPEAAKAFNKASQINPHSDVPYIELGRLYQAQGGFEQAEAAFKRALELRPDNSFTLNELGSLYSFQRRFQEAEPLFKQAISVDPHNKQLYGRLALIYSETGNPELFQFYSQEANRLSRGYYDSKTAANYRALKQILDKKGIKLVCVQYPMQGIEPLKKIFEQAGLNDIVFVDNEAVFKEAVSQDGYRVYFIDMFGGNFGHCTDQGNALLGQNIAKTILKQVFLKE